MDHVIDSEGKEVYVGLSNTPPKVDYSKLHQEGLLPEVSQEQLLCELQLLSLGNFFPLNIQIDTSQLAQELKAFENDWVPYLPRQGRVNNRQGLCLWGLPGESYKEGLSMPEARARTKRNLLESDFNSPTELYRQLPSLHHLCEHFAPLGRTFFVKSNEAGWFAQHRDGIWIGRDCFRLIVFIKNCRSDVYDFILDGSKLSIEEGRVYYLNTRLLHRTFSMINESVHLIINVPLNLQNVLKLISLV